MFHRDIDHRIRLNPATHHCQLGQPRRAEARSCHLRHASARGRIALCTFLAASTLAACSSAAPAPGESAVADDGTVTVTVLMKDMRFEPSVIEVGPGTHVIIEATNSDSMPHDLVFENDLSTDLLPRDKSATLDLGVLEETLDGWCSVSGHRAAGMTLTIEVTDAA